MTDNFNALKDFSDWILKIGDGNISEPNDGEVKIHISEDLLIKDGVDPIKAIVDSTYPSFLEHLNDLKYFQDKLILCLTLKNVDAINEYMLSLLPRVIEIYLSSDSVFKTDFNIDSPEDLYTIDFLNNIKGSGLPNHELRLKVGTPVMLLKNIDKSLALYNETRLIIIHLDRYVIESKIISGNSVGQKVLTP